ncbi:MAG: hypothetical protein HWD59_13730 [Coxiellaceae bacterium]|nr:MAG: hypothetical protein HWD59_13730 [Coxiellaceae bacterium]
MLKRIMTTLLLLLTCYSGVSFAATGTIKFYNGNNTSTGGTNHKLQFQAYINGDATAPTRMIQQGSNDTITYNYMGNGPVSMTIYVRDASANANWIRCPIAVTVAGDQGPIGITGAVTGNQATCQQM